MINADNFNVTTGKYFTNRYSEIYVKDDFNVTVGFYNKGYYNDYDVKIYVGNFHANVGGFFFNQFATINADDFYVRTRLDFYNEYASSINVADFNAVVGRHFYNNNVTEINADSFNITTGTFFNKGSITAESLGITTEYTVINHGSIVSNSLDITTDDFFRNLTVGDISVDTFNVIAGGKVTNTATINAGNFNIVANNESSRTDDTTGFYVSNRGDINVTNNFIITAEDDFYNSGNISANTFNIIAKNIFLLNSKVASDSADISLTGDSSFRADGGIIKNYEDINLGDFNLDILADSFINYSGATISDGVLNLNVESFIDNGSITARINRD